MDDLGRRDAAPRTARGRSLRSGLVAAGAAVGLALAGLGVAVAQTDGSTTAPPAHSEAPGPRQGGPGHRGFGHRGFGMGGIHGEFTTRAPGGGYQTIASQVGEVSEVSASAVTAKSEDGFSRTYGVDDNTLVNAGNSGIGDVKQGDHVRVMAVVRDGKASAVDLNDGTQVGQLRSRWMPPRPEPPGAGDRPS